METLTAQEAQEKLATLIRAAADSQSKYRITSNEGNVVLLPEEFYDQLLIALEVFSTPMFLETMSGEQMR